MNINIDMNTINQMMNNQNNEFMINCANHPACEGCKYNTINQQSETICETALERIRKGGQNNAS